MVEGKNVGKQGTNSGKPDKVSEQRAVLELKAKVV